MVGSISGVRFVRCPKCRRVLAEFANVPVYQCGGCNTILRAKSNGISGKTVFGGLDANPQDAPSRSSLDNESPKETTARTTEVDKGVQKAATDNLNSYLSDFTEKVVSSEHGEHITDSYGADIHATSPTKQSAWTTSAMDTMVGNSVAHKLEDEESVSLNVEEEKSSKLPEQGHESLKLNERTQDNAESVDPDIDTASEEDNDNRYGRHSNSLESTTRKSHNYGHSVSSVDVGGNTHASDDTTVIEDRSLRTEDIQKSFEIKQNQGGENSFVVDKVTGKAGNELQAHNLQRIPSNQGYTSDVVSRFDVHITDKSVKNIFHAPKDTSMDSADFHSVHNWFDSENDASSRHLPGDALFHEDSLDRQDESTSAKLRSLQNVQMKILKKVDELRDEINDLFHRPVEVKGRSHLRGTHVQNFNRNPRSKLVWEHPKANERESVSHRQRFAQSPSLLPPSLQPWFYEAQKHGHQTKREEITEKRKRIMHHCRPVLGGAPFVICYNCLNLLQLPLDFFVTRKRSYRLQCGACSKVLMFSFRPPRRGIPLTPNNETPTDDVQHPPSEVSTPQLSDGHNKWDLASYADGFELSFGIRNQVGVEKPLHDPGISSDPLTEGNRKFSKSSKLHRLMGYGSASELLFEESDIEEGFGTKEPSTPHCTSASENRYVRDRVKGKAIDVPSISAGETSPDSIEMHDEYGTYAGLRTRNGVSPLQRFQKS